MRLPHRPLGQGQPWRHRPGLIAVPLGLIVAITAVGLVTGADIHLGPLLIVAPAITAAIGGPRLTAFVGALAVSVEVGLSAIFGRLATADQQAQIWAIFAVSLFLVAFRIVFERHEQTLDQTRLVADVAQKVLLRPLPSRIGPLRIASLYIAAEAEARIGGDLYAVVRARQGTRIMIGDVRGKGLATVGDAALLLGAFRAAAHRCPPLPRLVAHLHNTVYWDMAEPAAEDEAGECFVTAAVLEIPDRGDQLRLINCGHPSPLLVRDGKVTPLAVQDPALPLGLGSDVTEDDYTTEPFAYRDGDLLLIYTDGVIEARDGKGAFYPLAERLAACKGAGPQQLIEHLHADLLAHTGGSLDDDVALVAIQRCP
ncbi:PP2C family protein-serine/threonine phosphatase [Streptomyces syringium]|uniref:PP2C family protein-serine/threonine phosphatase n=1 Tax=Streptomyces syringium TaxID=76729 RepID=UPI00369D3D1D